MLGYLDILEDTLLAFRLPAYEAKLRVRERRHPKLYWTDPGLPRAFKKQLDPPGAEEKGALFEGWVAEILRAHRDCFGLFDDWYYWASGKDAGVEVDFLLVRGKAIAAIEVKSSRRLSGHSLAGLKAVADLPRVTRRIAVYLGDHRQRTPDGIEVLPAADFLRLLEEARLF